MSSRKEKIFFKNVTQVSESIELGIMLAFAGGFMDAYSYMCRDRVFANAQTGNMLLCGIYLSQGKWGEMLRYLFPVLAFAVGILIADFLRIKEKSGSRLHWRQRALICEAAVLFLVGFLPQSMNMQANCLTSLACGIQVESFRKILGNGVATTMCIGNLRSATQNIFDYWNTKERAAAGRGILYFGIILSFIIGAVIGNVFVNGIAERALWICVLFLAAAFTLMFIDKEKEEAHGE